tara:strand:- start:6194 stop:7099 length:906 start_codon:yes stop_codon:yes gene_type:complete
MTVNRIQIRASLNDDKVVIPIGQTFDEAGREQLIETYEQSELQDNINEIIDYETTRYSHSGVVPVTNPITHDYNLFYNFYFADSGTFPIPNTFEFQGFTQTELNRKPKSFTNSFFKFDYYDSPERKKQKLMFSVIVPAGQCFRQSGVPIPITEYEYQVQISEGITNPTWSIYIPSMTLGPINDGENLYSDGYYLQWLKTREIIPNDTFYMQCKFFNAKTGKIVRMVNRNPIDPLTNTLYTFYDYPDWFFYEVKLKINYSTENPKYNYTIREFNNNTLLSGIPGGQAGTAGNPINFYEYVNP